MTEKTMGELVAAARENDQLAINEMYSRTASKAYFVAKQLMEDTDQIPDIIQESYVKAFCNLDKLENPEKFQGWLDTIVINKCKDYVKKKKPLLFSQLIKDDDEKPQDFEDTTVEFSPEATGDYSETKRLVGEMIDRLPEDQKMCLLLFYYEEKSLNEIAEIMDCPVNTVKSRLNYARKNIKKQVLDLEKQGTKLYCVPLVPFLYWFFRQSLLDAVGGTAAGAAVQTAGAAAGMAVAGSVGTAVGSAAGSAAGGTAGSIAGGTTGAATGSMTGGTAGAAAGSVGGGTTGTATGSMTGGTAGAGTGSMTGGTAGTAAGNAGGGTTGTATGSMTGEMAGAGTGSTTGGTAGAAAGSVGGETTGTATGSMTGGTAGAAAGNAGGGTTGTATGSMTGETTGAGTGSMTGGTAGAAAGNAGGGTTGTATESMTGGTAGAGTGSMTTGAAGTATGSAVGGVAGTTVGGTAGTVSGAAVGSVAAGTAAGMSASAAGTTAGMTAGNAVGAAGASVGTAVGAAGMTAATAGMSAAGMTGTMAAGAVGSAGAAAAGAAAKAAGFGLKKLLIALFLVAGIAAGGSKIYHTVVITPEHTIQQFERAYNEWDIDKMMECMSPEIQREYRSVRGLAGLFGLSPSDLFATVMGITQWSGEDLDIGSIEIEVLSVEYDDDTHATVTAEITLGTKSTHSETDEIALQKIDGKWYIME